MDFFAREEQTQRASRYLVGLFLLAMVLTLVLVWVVSGYLLDWVATSGITQHHRRFDSDSSVTLDAGQRHTIQLLIAAGTIAVILIGSVWKVAQLSVGGSAVANSLGGRLVEPGSREPQERQLINIIEEMSIASGVPLPQIFILDQENGINAFAAGHRPEDAAIAVTAGALARLSRDELQGVIAHEYSHILNGDMRLKLRLLGVVHGLLVITLVGLVFMRSTNFSSSNRDSRGLPLLLLIIGLALYIIGYIGYFFGGLIKAAVCRQRESLADAAAVQFTRNPNGLLGALKKIGGGGGDAGAHIEHEQAHESSHLFFAMAVSSSWVSLLATHPPIDERIRELDPTWDGSYAVPTTRAQPTSDSAAIASSRPASPGHPGPAPLGALGVGIGVLGAGVLASQSSATTQVGSQTGPGAMVGPLMATGGLSASLAHTVGTVAPAHVDFCANLIATLPPEVDAAARDPSSARALILALLQASCSERGNPLASATNPSAFDAFDAEMRATIADAATLTSEMTRLAPAVAALQEGARLPVLELTIPTLRQMSQAQKSGLVNLVVKLKGHPDLALEGYCLASLLEMRLRPTTGTTPVTRTVIGEVTADLIEVLSVLAHAADEDPAAQQGAFDAALTHLQLTLPSSERTLDRKPFNAQRLETAFAGLNQATPGLKRRIVYACAWCVSADGTVTVREAELLRLIAACLGCPMPPFAGAS